MVIYAFFNQNQIMKKRDKDLKILCILICSSQIENISIIP